MIKRPDQSKALKPAIESGKHRKFRGGQDILEVSTIIYTSSECINWPFIHYWTWASNGYSEYHINLFQVVPAMMLMVTRQRQHLMKRTMIVT